VCLAPLPLNWRAKYGHFLFFFFNVLLTVHLGSVLVNKQLDAQFFFSYIFFFDWRYNPLWVLAFSVIFFHSALSSHCFLRRLTPIICISSSMPAIHLFRGLPLVFVPIGFHCNILLGVLLLSIRIT